MPNNNSLNNSQRPTVHNIPDFREKDEYWCNVPREKMQLLNKMARETGDWLTSAKKIVPDYVEHFANFYRADGQFLWPTNKDSVILDAGSMWGGITLPAAQYHKDVYAVDKTMETLELLDIRAKQMGLHNIHPVAASLKKLPFKDNFFDLIILNGVLEWVALEDNIILSKQWRARGKGLKFQQSKKYSENPKQMQIQVLKELNRVLKPGGALYLAIENRVGYTYLLGLPDDHMNLPFICFLPRFLARAITKLILRCDYRTYVYTIKGYRNLLKQSGFSKDYFYGVFDHYINPKQVIPLELIKSLKRELFNNRKWQLRWVGKIIPGWLLKTLSPSVVALVWKSPAPSTYEPRIKQIFRQANLIQGDCADFKVAQSRSRIENNLPVNYLVYTDNSKIPKYFCKISRGNQLAGVLKNEAENLRSANAALKQSDLIASIPQLIYFGQIDGITFLVTKYIKAKKSKFNPNSRLTSRNLKQLDKEINLAMQFLVKFQQGTAKKLVDAGEYLENIVLSQTQKLKEKGLYSQATEQSLSSLLQDIKGLKDVVLPLGAVHGDFDFFYNIMFTGKEVKVLDFEHYESEGLPFLDFITLIFNPILMSFDHTKKKVSLGEILGSPRIKDYLRAWFKKYARLSELSPGLLRLAPALAALEQKTKHYPDSRNPNSFPMFEQKAFEEMLKLRMDL